MSTRSQSGLRGLLGRRLAASGGREAAPATESDRDAAAARRLRRDALLVAALALLVRLVALTLIDRRTFVFTKYPFLGEQFLHGEGPATGAFNASPLYLYFWYLMRVLDPTGLHAALRVQAVWGALTCGALCVAGGLLVGRRVGLVAGVLAVLYLPFVVNDASFVSEGLVLLLNTAALAFLAAGLRWGGSGSVAAAGLCLGLSAAARPNALLLVPFFASALALRPLPARRRLALVAACLLPALVGPLVITWRNWRVSGQPVFVMSDSGIVFYVGNNELATGLSAVWPRSEPLFLSRPGEVDPTHRVSREIAEAEVGRPLGPNEVADYWLAQGLSFVREHPGEYVRLLGRKLRYFYNGCEPHDVQTTFAQEQLLRLWPLVRFGWVAPLLPLGLAVTRRRWRELLPCYGTLATYTVTGLLFTVITRYRLPIVPAVLLFAAAALAWLIDGARQRSRLWWLALLGTAVCAAAVNWPDYRTRNLVADYDAAERLTNPTTAALAAGNLARAEALLLRAATERPTFSRTVSAQSLLAHFYRAAGRLDEARRWRRLARGPMIGATEPDSLPPEAELRRRLAVNRCDFDARLALGVRQVATGRADEAVRQFTFVAECEPMFGPALYNRAAALAAAGRSREALRWATATVRLSPDLPLAQALLVSLLTEDRLMAHLADAQRRAAAAADSVGWQVAIAEVQLRLGRPREAAEAFGRAVPLDPLDDYAARRLAGLGVEAQ